VQTAWSLNDPRNQNPNPRSDNRHSCYDDAGLFLVQELRLDVIAVLYRAVLKKFDHCTKRPTVCCEVLFELHFLLKFQQNEEALKIQHSIGNSKDIFLVIALNYKVPSLKI